MLWLVLWKFEAKNIGDCVGVQGLSIGTPLLTPPLLWLDNTFSGQVADNLKNLLFIFINIGDIPLGRGELCGDERLLIFLVPDSAPAAYQVQPKIM